MFRSGIQIPAGTASICRYGRYEAGTAGISTGTKHRGQSYWIAGWYGIFWPYRPVRYGIDNTGLNRTIPLYITPLRHGRMHIRLDFDPTCGMTMSKGRRSVG